MVMGTLAVELEALAEALYRFARSRGAGSHEAEDLAQEALVRALRARATLRDPGCFRGYAYGIARNLLADARRAARPARSRGVRMQGNLASGGHRGADAPGAATRFGDLEPGAPPAGGAHGMRLGEPEGPPPPYPWPDPEPGPLERALRSRRVTLNLLDLPLGDALRFLKDIGLPVEAEAGFGEDDARVSLRLRDIVAENALLIIAEQQGGDVYFDQAAGVARLVPEVPRHVAEARERRRILEGRGGFEESYRKILEGRRVTLNFPEITLSEAIAFLQDVTGLNIMLDLSVDPEMTITYRTENEVLRTALDGVLESAGADLRWTLTREAVVIAAKPIDPGPSLGEHRVSLALIGATVPGLVHALEAQGVPVVVQPSTWECRGTFSVLCDGAVPTPSRRSRPRARSAPRSSRARSGRPTARPWRSAGASRACAPLGDGPPARFAGVVAEWGERRLRLLDLCEARERARERARESRPLVPERLRALENDVARAAEHLWNLRRDIVRVLGARTVVTQAEAELRTAREVLVGAGARCDVARKRILEIETAPYGGTEEENRRLAKLKADLEIDLARASSELLAAEQRVAELEKALAAGRRDVAVLERLEQGARPSAAGLRGE